jgi:hypothetical protein
MRWTLVPICMGCLDGNVSKLDAGLDRSESERSHKSLEIDGARRSKEIAFLSFFVFQN